MSFSQQDAGQYIVVRNPQWDDSQLSGRVGLFDENGDPIVFTTNPPGTLRELADVTDSPGSGKAPVSDDSGDFALTEVATQAYVNEQVAEALSRWAVLGRRLTFVSAVDFPWQVTNPSVVMSPDGLIFGPYADGAGAGGSIRFHGLDGQPLSVVRNLAYHMRFTTDQPVAYPGAEPYLRIFTMDSVGVEHDAVFTPPTQPYPGLGAGPFQEWVATAGTWRYDDDSGEQSVGVPFGDIVATYGDHFITSIAITLGWTIGPGLTGLLRSMQINGNRYTFGN